MGKLKHTPGKWYKSKNIICRDGEDFAGGRFIKEICAICSEGNTGDEMDANARLIAVAPEMLEVLIEDRKIICKLCKRLNPQHESCSCCPDMEQGLDRVIEKATGQKINEIF